MRIAADANVLLAAVLGGRARLVLTHSELTEVLTTVPTLNEVEEYAVLLAERRRLRPDLLLLAVAALPVVVVERETYSRNLSEARRRIADRDPDDVDLFALALHENIPIWSNDRDFERAGVKLFTTERLLRHLRVIE